jgi:hypothetical protein
VSRDFFLFLRADWTGTVVMLAVYVVLEVHVVVVVEVVVGELTVIRVGEIKSIWVALVRIVRVCTMCGEAAEIVGAMGRARGALNCRRREEAHSTAEAVVLVLMFGGIFRALPSRARSAFLSTLRLAPYSRFASLCLSATPT